MRHFAAEKDVISGTFAQVTLRRRRNQAAFSWTEVVLLLFLMMIVLILLLSRVCGPSSNPARGQMIQTLGNMKQLHQATQSMALDSETTGDRSVGGWPGDTGQSYYL